MRRRKKKKTGIIITLFIFILLCSCGYLIISKALVDKKENIHYADNVITSDSVKIYSLQGDNYLESGAIGKNVELSLEKSDNKYFKIKDFEDYYIKYENVKEIKDRTIYDNRYKEYILFNYNVETDEETAFYDEEGNMIYSFNKGFSLPLIIKDSDRYGVEFNDRLLYIKMEEASLVEHHNTNEHNSSGVGVLNYHAFYDENDPDDSCATEICHSKSQFIKQLDFLKENNILTIKAKELEYYIDGKINLPKSVLITIDDGGRDKIAVDLLTEYKMYATIFLITSRFDETAYYKTDYIELHSHTHNLHDGGKCLGGQGGALKCLDKNLIQEDLKQSREELNGSTYIAYPFYEYNDYAIENLKEAGFTMAFIGESNNYDNLVHVGDDKFLLHRFVIVTYTTIKDLRNYFAQIK